MKEKCYFIKIKRKRIKNLYNKGHGGQGQNMLRQEEDGCSLEPVGMLELALFVGSSGACAGGVGWRF